MRTFSIFDHVGIRVYKPSKVKWAVFDVNQFEGSILMITTNLVSTVLYVVGSKTWPDELRIPKGWVSPLVGSAKLKIVDELQLMARKASGPGLEGSMHLDVILWHVERTPYVEAVNATLFGINAV